MCPPRFRPGTTAHSAWARLRNRLGYAASDWILAAGAARVSGLPAGAGSCRRIPALKIPIHGWRKSANCRREFDFPRRSLPSCFHYVGPLRSSRRQKMKFPWERLDGRPLIYSSLGTLQNTKTNVFQCFVEACDGLDVQLVIAGRSQESLGPLPENVIAAAYAPQLELLEKACLTITHGGLNTVLDSLSCGVPMIVLPLTYEQPAISMRVVRSGTGIMLPPSRLSAQTLRNEIANVRASNAYVVQARKIAAAMRSEGGPAKAVQIIENVGPF